MPKKHIAVRKTDEDERRQYCLNKGSGNGEREMDYVGCTEKKERPHQTKRMSLAIKCQASLGINRWK